MTVPQQLRLGTRSSLLAIAQSRIVASELERIHPGLTVKLVNLETRGDRDLQTPLTDVNDPDFFSAELDRALLDGEIDLSVHSFKDLDRNRPAGIITAAIPGREDPRDVILFRPDIDTVLQRAGFLQIGSSSLRRQINIGDFLPAALPQASSPPDVRFTPLRGPVHERVRRISPDAGGEQLDGVVLALAGLNRLWNDTDGRQAIAPWLAGARWMVLPLDACPTAAGQGALAIECRQDDRDTRELLSGLHNKRDADLVRTEIDLLDKLEAKSIGGVGATAVAEPELGFVAWLRGASDVRDKKRIEVTATGRSAQPEKKIAPWNDAEWLSSSYAEPLALDKALPESGAMFVAHWRAAEQLVLSKQARYWTSGVRSWRKLAARGVWVEGCAENLGFASIKQTLVSPVLQLPALQRWHALTHEDAVASWASSEVGHVVATYRSCVRDEDRDRLADQMTDCTHFYWSSARQYESLKDAVPANAQHACGTGKTLEALRAAGLTNVQPFVSRQEWHQWLA